MTTLVWMRSDLRLIDNPALSRALSTTGTSDVIVVRTSDSTPGCVPPTASRRAHETRRLEDMRPILETAGVRLVDAPDDDLTTVSGALGATAIVANTEVGDGPGYAHDRALRHRLRGSGVALIETPEGGIGRAGRRPSPPFLTGAGDIPPLRFAAPPEPLADLRRFLNRLHRARYASDMWRPGPDARATSRLSIDLACGALATDRVLHETAQARRRADPRHHHAFDAFAARIAWRRSFVQTLEDSVAAFPWGPVRHERPDDTRLMAAWLAGETGLPLVDAAMRDLTANGWINFRLRQVVCSAALDLLDLDMHEVGVALGALFDDYCPGIHWPQIGLQAGMARGRGPRVINPVKQAVELDPAGAYVRSHLPHLADVPDGWIHEPWRHPSYAGPTPVVDHMAAARAARQRAPAPLR